MRLAALYSCFNGLELLEKSIDQIYPYVAYLILCYQTVSNKGEPNPDIESFMERFKVDSKFHILKFEPNPNVNTKDNERAKLQLRIDYAKKLGCTHFFSSAEDHFYKPDEFVLAKDKVDNSIYDVTFTSMYTYYKHPTWQLTPIEDYYMPFICKLYPDTRVQSVPNYPLRVDPSIQINTCNNWYLFNQDKIMLHHFSMFRKDMLSKFRNAAASIRWKPDAVERFIEQYNNYDIESNPGVEYFRGRKIKIVDNQFEL